MSAEAISAAEAIDGFVSEVEFNQFLASMPEPKRIRRQLGPHLVVETWLGPSADQAAYLGLAKLVFFDAVLHRATVTPERDGDEVFAFHRAQEALRGLRHGYQLR